MQGSWRTGGRTVWAHLRRPLALASLMLPMVLHWGSGMGCDMPLYHAYASALLGGQKLYAQLQVEYPPLAVPCFVLPRLLATSLWGYAVAFMTLMALVDTLQRLLLMQAVPKSRRIAMLLSMAVLSSVLYYTYLKRFDVVAATCTSVALTLLCRRPHSLGAWMFLALGIGCKLYPVCLLPLCWQYSAAAGVPLRRRLQQLGVATLLGALTLAVIYQVAGNHCLDWLGYHRDRGLHLASSYTAVALAFLGMGAHMPCTPAYGCLQLQTGWADLCARLAPFVGIAGLGLTYLRVLRAPEQLWRGALALVSVVLLTSKVFSPQYMIWLLPCAVISALRPAKIDWTILLLMLVCCICTAELHPNESMVAAGKWVKQGSLMLRTAALTALWGHICLGDVSAPLLRAIAARQTAARSVPGRSEAAQYADPC